MTNLLFLVIGTVTLLIGVWRALRLPVRGGSRGVVITVVALGMALLLLAPSVQRLESMLYPSLGRLASNVATLTAAYGLLTTVSELGGEIPSRHRRWARTGIYCVAVAALVATFFTATGLPAEVGTFHELYATHPMLVSYVAIYIAYLGVAILSIARIALLCLPPSRAELRIGLVTLVGGCALAGIYLVSKVVSTWQAAVADGPLPSSACASPLSSASCAASVAAPALSIACIAGSVVLIALGARRARRRYLVELAPLHRAVVRRLPAISKSWMSRHTGDHLVRTVVEIRDGLLALQISDEAPEAAARAIHQTEQHPDPARRSGGGVATSATVWDELERLRPVAQAYARLTEVHQ